MIVFRTNKINSYYAVIIGLAPTSVIFFKLYLFILLLIAIISVKERQETFLHRPICNTSAIHYYNIDDGCIFGSKLMAECRSKCRMLACYAKFN
jgi:hypothetical protein